MSGSTDPSTGAGGSPRTCESPPARTRARDDSPPTSGATDPSRHDASIGVALLAAERVSGADADPCSTTMTSGDALAMSTSIWSALEAISYTTEGMGRAVFS